MLRILTLLALLSTLCANAANPPTITDKTAGLQKIPGYFNLYWDEKGGKMWLEIDKLDTEFLYVNSLPAGMGSNDIGLDRGQIGGQRIVKFYRSGNRVLLIESNYRFRAVSNDAPERNAVEQAFAQSALWGFTVEAEENGHVLADATAFFLRDVHDAAGAISRSNQGTFRVDPARCAFYLPRTKGFPHNTEVETIITLAGDRPGMFVRSVTPAPDSLTVREHHSFVQLPDPGYEPRAFDPRSGYFEGNEYMDFATPISEPIMKRFIGRHRLKKKDPSAAISDPVEPIVYYLDPGTPEPIRSALLEGARWWNQAFEAAGYRNAFRVEMLPSDADPMDVRYNLIQWVHRSTRGWSYGAGISDPRTGEIIKGQVTLGSLRVRQDYLIAEALLAPYETGKPAPPAMQQMALARLRQLSAHEVGHTLGLAHNFAASMRNRESVMDYPPPYVKVGANGVPDLSDAYATGIGEWDKVAIAFGYQDFPAGTNVPKALDGILRKATAAGHLFISDADSRPEGGAHPSSHLWDSGTNAVDELNRLLEVRAQALARFGERNIREGAPMSSLGDTLVLAYLLHRYQVEAASKVLGGAFYTYALRGDGQRVLEVVNGSEQRRALDALMKTIAPETLTLRPEILDQIPPRATGYPTTREDFRAHTGLTFDPLGAAESAADLTVRLLLNPERAARLVQYHAQNATMPGLADVIDRLIGATWKSQQTLPGLQAEVRHVTQGVVIFYLMALAQSDAFPVRVIAMQKLEELRSFAEKTSSNDPVYAYAVQQIKRFQTNPREIPVQKPIEAPPGQPIGCDWQ